MVDAVNRPAAENAAASVPPAPVAQAPVVAPIAPVAPAAYNSGNKEAVDTRVPVLPANTVQGMPMDVNQMRRMVPCSEEECMRGMTAEEQDAFKRKCFELLNSQQKTAMVNGQSRVANAGHELRFFQLNLPSTDANQRVAQTANGKTVGNRPVVTSTAPQFGFNTAVPTDVFAHHAENMYVMPAATEFKGVNPSDHVQGVQRQEQHAPIVNSTPAPVAARDQPQIYQDGKDTTWMFFPRPQNVKMTPEEEQQWMQECQRIACQKINSAMPSDKVNGQARVVAVPTTPKEQAELQKEVKQILNKNAAQQPGPHGVEVGKGRPDGKNL
ncbi:hypothetical protein LPJ56_001526, partial [Coemansia sp. RSA 2599]